MLIDTATQALARPSRPEEERMAGPKTQLIRNCWYIAAWADEIGPFLLSRRLLGRQILLFRTANGQAVALHDRCPHRSLPLSKGHLEGDQVRCGYHGLLFNSQGVCTEAPPVGRAPQAMRVPAYTLVERGPLLWIWLGEGRSRLEAIPDTAWLNHPDWSYGRGAMTINSNYVALHENLLDLTHFTFLHPGNIGTPEYAKAPYSVSESENTVRVERYVADCPVPGIYAATGLGDQRISRRTISEFLSPALHSASVDLVPHDSGQSSRSLFRVRVTHFVTPRDLGATHYFFAIARNFEQDDPEVTRMMQKSALQAFKEDADALEAISLNQLAEPDFHEKSMKSDRAGVMMRRIIKRLADAEGVAA